MYLDSYLGTKYHDLLIQDYLCQFKVKPKRWYQPTLSPQQRKLVIRYLVDQYHLFTRNTHFRYALVEKLQQGYLDLWFIKTINVRWIFENNVGHQQTCQKRKNHILHGIMNTCCIMTIKS